MSRLPVPRTQTTSEPSHPATRSTTMNKSLKRSRNDDDDEDDTQEQQPAKKLARPANATGTGAATHPLRIRALNASRAAAAGPSNLAKPRVPSLSKPRGTVVSARGRGATLGSSGPTTRSTSAARGRGIGRGGRVMPGGRAVSSGLNSSLGKTNEERFQQLEQDLQAKVLTMGQSIAAGVAADMDAERQKMLELQESSLALSRELQESRLQELERRRALDSVSDEIESLKKKHAQETEELDTNLRKRERELRVTKEEKQEIEDQLDAERARTTTLKATIAQMSTSQLTVESQKAALTAQLSATQTALENERGTTALLRLDVESREARIAELEAEARQFESVRRRMHNIILELKGNIRVFCRVRPVLPSDLAETGRYTNSNNVTSVKKDIMAPFEFPDDQDHKDIVLSTTTESVMGQERKETHHFSFDRVFGPESTQMQVFEEVSLLAQSVIDGFNVCIFAYGQTGSGKSYTMEGGASDTAKGMIPRAVDKIFDVTEDLKSKGWEYKMEGQFLEIYNETINDLLGSGEFDKKKHEIKHDPKIGTRVTDVNVITLGSAAQVRQLLTLAASRRTVAATLMNERSSRSHSVFTLRVYGSNPLTGETCSGCLNLVDLAGSERLNASGAGSDKDRLKETQNINKSLSALGDVIAALGEKEGKGDKHIPYRNSKLTYLLQNSLSGSSKTLMILNVSPLKSSMNESLCSLRFATKVNNTHVGTAKKTRSGSA